MPFQPVGGVHGSDLAELNGWVKIDDPYGSGDATYVIPSIRPDVAVIHANEATVEGDVRVFGSTHWDRVMTRAARKVLVVAERLVDASEFEKRPELTLVPGFLVEAVSIVPHGAWPGSCWPDYGVDYDSVSAYLDTNAHTLDDHLATAPEATS